MAYTSDLEKDYTENIGKSWDISLSELGSAFVSALSLSLKDTVLGTLKEITRGIVEKKINKIKWKKQIEKCILAAD